MYPCRSALILAAKTHDHHDHHQNHHGQHTYRAPDMGAYTLNNTPPAVRASTSRRRARLMISGKTKTKPAAHICCVSCSSPADGRAPTPQTRPSPFISCVCNLNGPESKRRRRGTQKCAATAKRNKHIHPTKIYAAV